MKHNPFYVNFDDIEYKIYFEVRSPGGHWPDSWISLNEKEILYIGIFATNSDSLARTGNFYPTKNKKILWDKPFAWTDSTNPNKLSYINFHIGLKNNVRNYCQKLLTMIEFW